MSTKDLTSLAQTVTSRLIVPETNGEAVSAIILHTDRPIDLLRRKKVKKEFLFKYLNAKRVSIEATADKATIIAAVLQLWGSASSQSMASGSSSSLILSGGGSGTGEEDSLPEAPAPSRNTSYSSLCSLDYGPGGIQAGGSNLGKILGHLPLNIDALTTGLARTRSSGGCDDKSSTHSNPYPLRRTESANSFTMDDEDDFEDITRTSSTIHNTSSSSTTTLSCDPLRTSEPMPSHQLSSSYQPPSMFSSGGQTPFLLHARLSQSLTPTPPPMLSSSLTSSAIPVAVPSSSSSSPLSGVYKLGSANCGNNVPAATAAAASLLLSSSAPSSFDPSSFFPDHQTATVPPPHLHSPSSTSSGSEGQQEAANEMADSFVKWFYELINSTFYSSETTEFGPQHFWTDASAKISLHQGSSSSHHSSSSSSLSSTPTAISMLKEANVNGVGGGSETICVQENGKQVAEALKHIVDKYRITYNPNMTRDGISGFVDAHGLALVTACGTLHNPATSTVCGTFQQQFGLIRDPNLGNNWKIKFTHANLVSKESVSQQPTLAQQHHLLQQSLPFSSSHLHHQQPQPQSSFLHFNVTSSDANTPFVSSSSGESGASSSASSTSDAFPSSTSSAMAIS